MTKIFISYSHIDIHITEKLDNLLELIYGDGNVWYDTNIRGAKEWWEQIVNEIKKCDVVIYLLSKNSHESEFCQHELDEARKYNKPIVVMQTDKEFPIPDIWRQHQCDKLYDENHDISLAGYSRLNGAILDALNFRTGFTETHKKSDLLLIEELFPHINRALMEHLSHQIFVDKKVKKKIVDNLNSFIYIYKRAGNIIHHSELRNLFKTFSDIIDKLLSALLSADDMRHSSNRDYVSVERIVYLEVEKLMGQLIKIYRKLLETIKFVFPEFNFNQYDT